MPFKAKACCYLIYNTILIKIYRADYVKKKEIIYHKNICSYYKQYKVYTKITSFALTNATVHFKSLYRLFMSQHKGLYIFIHNCNTRKI